MINEGALNREGLYVKRHLLVNLRETNTDFRLKNQSTCWDVAKRVRSERMWGKQHKLDGVFKMEGGRVFLSLAVSS